MRKKMLRNLDLAKILFLDIETVPEEENYQALSSTRQALWAKKPAISERKNTALKNSMNERGFGQSFGKIVCISVGFLTLVQANAAFVSKVFQGKSELLFLHSSNFAMMAAKSHLLCAHNGKEFDFPYLARRMVIHGIECPGAGLVWEKTVEVPHLDTLQLWKFGDYKHFTSLALLTEILGIPSPKTISMEAMLRGFIMKKKIFRALFAIAKKTS